LSIDKLRASLLADKFLSPMEARMTAKTPLLYFDLGSPFAYLALERAASLLGVQPELQPVLLGAIFARRGFGSWANTPARDARISEIEQRARRYGLPALGWPAAWPGNGLIAMRCATWAQQQGQGHAFARAVFRREFAQGADIAEIDVLVDAGIEAGLDADALREASASSAVKQALREATDDAWALGVRGIPTVRVDDTLFYGDDQLELAAASLAGS
jgi:2-hydroxychromene-2-carboxylate isomerase